MKDLVRSTMLFVTRSIYRYIPSKHLRRIYVVGSLSTNEATTMRNESSDQIFLSDFDIILDVSIGMYLRCFLNGFARKLSEMLTNCLRSRGLKTHVSIAITSFKLSRLIPLVGPNALYLYELTPVMMETNRYSLSPSAKSSVQPSNLDSINLIFSAIADYLPLKLGLIEKSTVYEECYTTAKRCLTVFYSLMLFKKMHPRSYVSRVTLAKKEFHRLDDVLSQSDIDILETLTHYKLSGNWVSLAQKLPVEPKTIHSTLKFVDDFFKILVVKAFTYELSRYFHSDDEHKLKKSVRSLAGLLEEYKSRVRVPPAKRLAYLASYSILGFMERDSVKLRTILQSLLTYGLTIEDLLRYLVGVMFLSIVDEKRKSRLRSVVSILLMWNMYMA